jgi:crotonobetainyl-CoA:carnitine CoA-transferase CaiB-like acyl-CoA transferase
MKTTETNNGPLSGITVLDLTNIIMGPFATQILGDMGAEVIKVESPEGDGLRYANYGRHTGMSNMYLNSNRNKRSIVLNLKHEAGRAVFCALAAKSDVVVSNMRPQAMARLKLAYDDIFAVNPKIIYVACFGFGQTGPYADRAAYDDLIQAMCGVPDLIERTYGDSPRYLPSNFCDRVTGLSIVNAVTGALFYRERTGKGQAIEIPMFETMVQFLMSDHLGGYTFEPPHGPSGYARVINAYRRPYKTRDGQIGLLVYNDKQWAQFFTVIGQADMIGQGIFATMTTRGENIAQVYEFMDARLAERTTQEWLDLLGNTEIPHTAAVKFDDLFENEHLNAVGFFPTFTHPSEGQIRTTAIPSQWSQSQPSIRQHAPKLGEHSTVILRELGYSKGDIAALVRSGTTKLADENDGLG